MINVTEDYNELIINSIRPKCEPQIKVSGKDASGEKTEYIWNPRNILGFSYKRKADPLGREIPSIELTWTEIYIGKLTEETYPEKYNNILQYMAVDLSFFQTLNSKYSWSEYYSPSINWGDVNKKGTWGDILSKTIEIKTPRLFLEAKPSFKNNTITWKARDFLYFLSEEISVKTEVFEPPLFFDDIETSILKRSQDLWQFSEELNNEISATASKLSSFSRENNILLKKPLFLQGAAKNIFINHWQSINIFWDFDYEGGVKLQSIAELNTLSSILNIPCKIMYNYPEIQKSPNVSQFSSRVYNYSENDTKSYLESITKTQKGETYNEDNKLNVYSFGDDEGYLRERSIIVPNYFENSSSIVFTSLPILHLETGDVIKAQTNLYDNFGQRTYKKGVIVDLAISYNGAYRQTFIIHELS